MIVKNESKIIERLLTTVLPIIDSYCICDTGSTDNTIEVIQNFMKTHGKPGEVYVEPFKNFGYNRDHALQRAAKWGKYALLLDADMKLIIEPGFDKSQLTADGYNIIQKNPSMQYYNTRIVKTGIGVKCVCPTHEYYDFPTGTRKENLTTLWINDIGDGGCKTNKFERDIKLLLQGIIDEPTNARYYFYLANSYRDIGKYQEAIRHYKKRVELGGWIEEVFMACNEIGKAYRKLGDDANAVYWWLEAYNKYPKRAESLYQLVRYYRETGKQQIGQAMCDLARTIPFPKDDLLFIETPVYEYLLFYEHTILTYYTRKEIDHMKYLELIGRGHDKHNVLTNYKFYVKSLKNIRQSRIDAGALVDMTPGPQLALSGTVPGFFRELVSCGTGCVHDNELFHLCKITYKTETYHILIVLDADTHELKRHTILFRFEGHPEEVGMTVVVVDDNVAFSYKIGEKESTIYVPIDALFTLK